MLSVAGFLAIIPRFLAQRWFILGEKREETPEETPGVARVIAVPGITVRTSFVGGGFSALSGL